WRMAYLRGLDERAGAERLAGEQPPRNFLADYWQHPARDREHLRLMAGRDGVRFAPGTRLACFTERDLRAWLERRSGRRVGQFVHWLDTQVLVPHRRKLELTGRVPAPRLPDDE
ncbi:MAG: hypothetical protein ACK54L_21845, partial [Betaproteobacteria bacterium]